VKWPTILKKRQLPISGKGRGPGLKKGAILPAEKLLNSDGEKHRQAGKKVFSGRRRKKKINLEEATRRRHLTSGRGDTNSLS